MKLPRERGRRNGALRRDLKDWPVSRFARRLPGWNRTCRNPWRSIRSKPWPMSCRSLSMNRTEAETLVRETMDAIGVSGPELLEDDSPTLAAEQTGGIYLVGLIGGKEGGKSALVNALAGAPITTETSHGPGTQMAVAYVHRAR